MATYNSIDAWAKDLKKDSKKLQAKVHEETNKVAQWGLKRARTIVPKDTHSLMQAITAKSAKSQKKSQAFIFVRSMNNPKYSGRYSRVPRYAAIQHKMARHSHYQAKSGDPHWAFTVQREVEKKTGERLNIHIQKFISK